MESAVSIIYRFFGEFKAGFPGVSRESMSCPESVVFQLRYEVKPAFLYHSENYNFRTLTISKIEKELDFLYAHHLSGPA